MSFVYVIVYNTVFVLYFFIMQGKGKKRPRSDVSPSGPSKKKTDESKKKPGPKKRRATKKDPDAGDNSEKTRFQQTVRCSISEVVLVAKLLKDSHRTKVCQAVFGCVFYWVLETNVTRILMCHLMMNIDTKTMKIESGS